MADSVVVLDDRAEPAELPIDWRDAVIVVIGYFLATIAVSFVCAIVGGVILAATTPGLDAARVGDMLKSNFAFIVTSTTLSAAAVLWLIRRRLKRLSPRPWARLFPPVGVRTMLAAASAAVLMVAVETGLDWVLKQYAGISVDASTVEAAMMPTTPVQLGVVLAAFVLFVPFYEEVLFRGVILGWLKRIGPAWLAIVLSAALFSLAHGLFFMRGGISGWVGTGEIFVVGALAALFAVRTGSLWPAWVIHIVNNGLAFALGYLAAH